MRWASGKDGMLGARDAAEAEEEARAVAAPAAGSVSSWGGNVGDMILLTGTR